MNFILIQFFPTRCTLLEMNDFVLTISAINKTYSSGLKALSDISLEIRRGEIFALLGPNGAGKTTLINIICGIVNQTGGTVVVDGHDTVKDYRAARARIGLVPQELTVHAFETVMDTVKFSRGLFGKRQDSALLEKILKALSLWEKKDSKVMTLSGGMKRRVMIAKALSHEPTVLFLDEPSAGVDVKLRHDLWAMVRKLREEGVTIILTTHYLEEAEDMADRIGVINNGKLILVEDKNTLIKKMGKRQLTLFLAKPFEEKIPEDLSRNFALSPDGMRLVYSFEVDEQTSIADVLRKVGEHGIVFKNLQTSDSSLEDIFVTLVEGQA
jgi:ABC-2 type transport system ATP-binding protein